MWFKKLLGVFVTLGLVLAACSGGGTTPSPSGSGDTSSAPSANDAEQVLRVDLGGEPPTLDPTQATDSQSINVLRSITRPLA
jgi:oligopeptide transport system substrate-binding protein